MSVLKLLHKREFNIAQSMRGEVQVNNYVDLGVRANRSSADVENLGLMCNGTFVWSNIINHAQLEIRFLRFRSNFPRTKLSFNWLHSRHFNCNRATRYRSQRPLIQSDFGLKTPRASKRHLLLHTEGDFQQYFGPLIVRPRRLNISRLRSDD